MGEQDHALHEIADARARLSELADELARKAEPDRLKAIATEKATEWKERAKDVATHKVDELKQHAKDAAEEKVDELKTRAKEKVMQRTTELKERADTPKGWSLLGSIIGAGIGAALMRKAFAAREDRHLRDEERWRYDSLRARPPNLRYRGEGYRGEDRYDTAARVDIGYREDVDIDVGYGAGTSYEDVSGDDDVSGRGELREGAESVKARASDAAQTVKDKAVDLKDRAVEMKDDLRGRASEAVHHVKDRASHLREQIPPRDELQHRASDWFSRTLEEQPLLLAVGGIAMGMVASTLLPVSNRERRLIEPARRRAGAGIQQLGEQLEQKLQGGSEQQGIRQDTLSGAGFGTERPDLGTPATTGGYGASSSMDIGVSGQTKRDVDGLASSPSGTSRIPPLPPLDDLTKVH
jgi:hypothetical protein